MCDIICIGDKVNNQFQELLDELRSYDEEREWFEFKENWFDQTQLGQYISALSNSAAIEGRKNAYFVWGIHNETHDVTGTNFSCNMDIKNEPLKHWLCLHTLRTTMHSTAKSVFFGHFWKGRSCLLKKRNQ